MKISSQYAKLYLAHVQVAKPITPRNKQVFRKLDEPVLLHKILKKNGIRTLVAGMERNNA